MMTSEQISRINIELRQRTPLEITRWAISNGAGRAIVSTNFRPYEALLLRLCTLVEPAIPVLWVDHGFNRPATYRHAEQLKALLGLNLKTLHPRISAAHYEAMHGAPPSPEDEEGLKAFSRLMKLEPFQRGMSELSPRVWITALRKSQNPNRAAMDIVSDDRSFGVLKVSPFFHSSEAELEAGIEKYELPNEWDYFDPAKADEKRECGLHAAWGSNAPSKVSSRVRVIPEASASHP
jgi:phosphoadenosine phosphosulfate reductase